MGKIKGFLFAVRHREIIMTDLGLTTLYNKRVCILRKKHRMHTLLLFLQPFLKQRRFFLADNNIIILAAFKLHH